MKVLVVDIGGTHVKILATGHRMPRRFVSGPTMTPQQMVAGVQKIALGWNYDVLSKGTSSGKTRHLIRLYRKRKEACEGSSVCRLEW